MDKRQEKRFRRSWTTQSPRAAKKSRVDEKLIVVLYRLPVAVVPKKYAEHTPEGYVMSLEMEIHTDIEGKVRLIVFVIEWLN